MLLAEVEIRHSRPIAPTRRVALGLTVLPTGPEHWGAVLLAAMVAVTAPELEPDAMLELLDLLDLLERGERPAQPQLRHRFQRDVIGLDRSVHSLRNDCGRLAFDIDDHALPEVTLVAALHAAAQLPDSARPFAFRYIRKSLLWKAGLDGAFVSFLVGDDSALHRWFTMPSETQRAMQLLGYGPEDRPTPTEIKLRFRERIWAAHPDRGGDAEQMLALNRARTVLMEIA